MAKLDFDIGARVYCKDGDCGKLLKVVVDPYTQRVIDLIVEKGLLLKKDRVLPAEVIGRTSNGDVYLDIAGDALEAYPEYREIEFQEPAPGVQAGVYRKGDVRCWQGGYTLACDNPVIPMVKKQIHQGVDSDLAVIERGTLVKNAQERIGQVDHLLVDVESGKVTHLVLRKGFIPYHPILPISEVTGVSNEVITVDLTEKEIQALPRYRSRSAEDIQAELRDRLVEQGFDLAQMKIEIVGSIVQLMGWVPNVAAKRHAEAVARAVEGVIDVENLLDTDIAIETRVVQALLSDPRTHVSVIEVINESGIVTLQGKVDHIEIRDAAQEIASSQPGVLSVVNALEVQPDEDSESLIARALAWGPRPHGMGGFSP